MKNVSRLMLVAIVVMGMSFASCEAKKEAKLENTLLENKIDSMSYAIGLVNGDGFKDNIASIPGEPLDMDIILAAFRTGAKADTNAFKMTLKEARDYLNQYQ